MQLFESHLMGTLQIYCQSKMRLTLNPVDHIHTHQHAIEIAPQTLSPAAIPASEFMDPGVEGLASHPTSVNPATVPPPGSGSHDVPAPNQEVLYSTRSQPQPPSVQRPHMGAPVMPNQEHVSQDFSISGGLPVGHKGISAHRHHMGDGVVDPGVGGLKLTADGGSVDQMPPQSGSLPRAQRLRGSRTAEGGDGLPVGDPSLSKRDRDAAMSALSPAQVKNDVATTDIVPQTPAEVALKQQMETLKAQLNLLMQQQTQQPGVSGALVGQGSAPRSEPSGNRCIGGDAFEGINHQNWPVPQMAPLEKIQKWNDAVADMQYEISKFQLGGKPLRDFIHDKVNKIKLLRHNLFCSFV